VGRLLRHHRRPETPAARGTRTGWDRPPTVPPGALTPSERLLGVECTIEPDPDFGDLYADRRQSYFDRWQAVTDLYLRGVGHAE